MENFITLSRLRCLPLIAVPVELGVGVNIFPYPLHLQF
ncbi:hypothetical protein VCHENC03_1430 [Vibrio sp. HENC-03]|nr:hypothetical protein VCHENC03_1430 [Vibrio sp. HENC-03]